MDSVARFVEPAAKVAVVAELHEARRHLHALRSAPEPGDQGDGLQAITDKLTDLLVELESVHRSLDAERERYRELFDDAPTAYLITNVDGIITASNRAANALVGGGRRLAGRSLGSLLPRAAHRAFKERLRHTAANLGEASGPEREWTFKKMPDDAMITVSADIAAVRDTEGEPVELRWILHDVTENRRRERRLTYLAHHDQLTGLPNRELFAEMLTVALSRARRAGDAVAVLWADLDEFKAVNDFLGHAAGDELLGMVGRRLRRACRAADVVARFGGDEFAMLLGDLPLAQPPAQPLAAGGRAPETVAARITDAMAAPFIVGNLEIRISASIGTCLFPTEAKDEQGLLEGSDDAMYRSKASGRRCHPLLSAAPADLVAEIDRRRHRAGAAIDTARGR